MTATSTSIPENTDPRCPNNQWLALGPDHAASSGPLRSTLEMYGAAVTASWHPNEVFTLRSISAYRRTQPFSMRDADNTPQLILHTINQDDLRQFSGSVTMPVCPYPQKATYSGTGAVTAAASYSCK